MRPRWSANPGLVNQASPVAQGALRNYARVQARVECLDGLPLAEFQLRLALVGGVGRVGTGLDSGLLQKISPASMPVLGGLAAFEVLYGRLRILLASDDLDHSGGFVGPHVVSDDGVGRRGFVAGQRTSVSRSKPSADWKISPTQIDWTAASIITLVQLGERRLFRSTQEQIAE